MRRSLRSFVFIHIFACLLYGCNKSEERNTKVSRELDSLKIQLEGTLNTNYSKSDSIAYYGMKMSTDSDDYYYFMCFLASSRQWRTDYKSEDTLQNRIRNYIKKTKLSPKLNDLKARYYMNKGNYYILNHKPDLSIENYHLALKYQVNGTRLLNRANILVNLSDGYLQKSDYANGANCLRKVLFLSDSLVGNDYLKIKSINGLAMIYLGLRDFKESDKYFKMGEKLIPQMHGRQRFFFYNSRGNYYYYKEDFKNALKQFKVLNEMVSDSLVNPFDRNLVWINLADAYIKMGEIDSAKFYQKKCRRFFEDNNNETALYYLDTQNIAIALHLNRLKEVHRILNRPNGPKTKESDQIIIRYKYLYDYYNRIGDYEKALTYYKIMKHTNDSVRNEREKLATIESEMRYNQNSKALKLQLNLAKSEEQLHILQLFLIICILIITLLVFVFMYYRKRKQIIQKREQQRVLKLRMEELRNRVSPHFVFNVLNYELYNRQHGKDTTDIPILVKLIRNGLEISDELCVPLLKELDFVEGYVKLQENGMGNNFMYRKDIAENVDLERVKIPSMMVQIVVENSIKHGLRGLKRDKELYIKVERGINETTVDVIDNGRGLDVDNERNEQGTGTGMRVIRETLDMLNDRNDRKLIFEIKKNPHGSGCCVEIKIPDEYDYSLC